MELVFGIIIGFVFGCLITQWITLEFIKDQVDKGKMYYADKHGKWFPKNPVK